MVRIGTPRRKLRGVLVFLLLAALGPVARAEGAEPRSRTPLIPRKGDCAILGAEAEPFEAGDLVTVVESKDGKISAVWASSLQGCSKPEKISGWLPADLIARASPDPRLILHESPGGPAKGRLSPGHKFAWHELREGWRRVSSLEGDVPVSAVKYVKLKTAARASGLVLTPEELKIAGKSYEAKAICGGHLFTEAASFYLTGEPSRPLAVFCSGTFEGEKSYLTLFGKSASAITIPLDPGESASISDRELIRALDRALGGEIK